MRKRNIRSPLTVIEMSPYPAAIIGTITGAALPVRMIHRGKLDAVVAGIAGAWVAFAPASHARAADGDPLPGVKGGYRIVQPAPPRTDEDVIDEPAGTQRHGKWDVTISGDVTIDVGAGALPRSGRDRTAGDGSQ